MGVEGKVGKKRKGRRAGRSRGGVQRWGLPPFWSSLRRDGGHTGTVERWGGDQQEAS